MFYKSIYYILTSGSYFATATTLSRSTFRLFTFNAAKVRKISMQNKPFLNLFSELFEMLKWQMLLPRRPIWRSSGDVTARCLRELSFEPPSRNIVDCGQNRLPIF